MREIAMIEAAMDKVEISTTIDEEVNAEIQRIARDSNTSEADVIQKILLDYLSQVGLSSEMEVMKDRTEYSFDDVMVSFDAIQKERDQQKKAPRVPTALVVEDDLTNMFYLERLLQRFGYSMIGAYNGNDAIQQIQKHSDKIDVVFMDLHMPICDGFEAMEKISELGPEISEIPIIVITANADRSVRQKCLDKGIKDFILKPYKADKLETALKGITA